MQNIGIRRESQDQMSGWSRTRESERTINNQDMNYQQATNHTQSNHLGHATGATPYDNSIGRPDTFMGRHYTLSAVATACPLAWLERDS